MLQGIPKVGVDVDVVFGDGVQRLRLLERAHLQRRHVVGEDLLRTDHRSQLVNARSTSSDVVRRASDVAINVCNRGRSMGRQDGKQAAVSRDAP